MKAPENVDGLIDHLTRFQVEMQAGATALPPSKAKEMINEILNTVKPLTVQFQELYPQVRASFEQQRHESEEMLVKARQNIAKAQANLANLPSVEEIKKNLVPLVPALSTGLTSQYAVEMQSRYLQPVAASPGTVSPGAAWQDWMLN